MNIDFGPKEEAFRREVADWLKANLQAEFKGVRGRGGPGDEGAVFAERLAWERHLGEHGWTCVGWPSEYGGRGCSIAEQVIFFEEYARAGGPGRVGHIGETLAGPTIIAFGTEAQRARFLPGIRSGRELWCQGYSEPAAGSDLAAVHTRAERDEATGEWVIQGQKTWTSLATEAQWMFVLCRTERGSVGQRGLSYLLVPMDQPGVEVRPIRQLTGDAEFNEVFFDDARTAAENIVGAPGEGWKVAMGTLAFERGVSTLGQQMSFANELERITAAARANGAAENPLIRQRLADAYIGLKVMRYSALRMLSAEAALSPMALTWKLYWATWHRSLGELAMDVLGPAGEIAAGEPYQLDFFQRLFLFTRADTIYAGTNEIQRNIIAERALGMPREPRGDL